MASSHEYINRNPHGERNIIETEYFLKLLCSAALTEQIHVCIMECHVQDVLNFGRSGAGAPVRDSQGQVRAVVVGNPEIR